MAGVWGKEKEESVVKSEVCVAAKPRPRELKFDIFIAVLWESKWAIVSHMH